MRRLPILRLSVILVLTMLLSMTSFSGSLFAVTPLTEVDQDHPYNRSVKEAEQEKNINPQLDIKLTSDKNANNYPIVLVHGLGGFKDLYGIPYWGGLTNIPRDLRNKGYEVYVAEIGPVSSNWDRAAELYAQIKGGTVDYGEAHAAEHGHLRFGRTYDGLYPEWGEVNPKTGKVNKVHLIGHSLGGPTSRALIQLLEEGHPAEVSTTSATKLSPLFQGKKEWVHSAVSLSSPHDGSTATYYIDNLIPHIQEILAVFAALQGNHSTVEFDFQLDHWGLKREAGESFDSYVNRVKKSNIWKTKDTAKWDARPIGAQELNEWIQGSSSVYYFSLSTEQTYRSIFTGYHKPELFMNPIFYDGSRFMGRHRSSTDGIHTGSDWWENDGVVNTNSMDGPTLHSDEQIVTYDGSAERGKWNHLGTLNSVDHLDVIGIGVRDMRWLFRDMAEMLTSLPD
ncbi:triacylglycerol lipase [Mechercharimyces sp. CAU 1602]|uniref:esterase/lipase family protein n=1 Tax=Mechercharimyces sp. CAU 1602 TaxID=2973933 RepID=UPI0021618BB2|nr:lipase [Mechercharimyces sp. CAU 1602]MCS1352078.1 lipase [Mechercharimyces sp. CAU 1602]